MESFYDVLDAVSPRITDSQYEEFVKKIGAKYDEREREIRQEERSKYWASMKRDGIMTIDEHSIQRAKDYPITAILDTEDGRYVNCIFHYDTHPSMLVKNNFAYCFSCGESADSIKAYMSLAKVDFIKAVKDLSGIV